MKCSLRISNFLEEISSLSHSVVFLYFFALIVEEGFLLFLLFFGTLHSDAYIFPFLLCFSVLFFSQLFVRPPQTAILLFCISFPWGWSWSLSPVQCHEPRSIVHSARDQPWDFFGRNNAKADAPVLWPPHAKSWLIGKDSDAGRDWGQEEKGTTEDEMAGWHYGLDGCESEWTLGDGDGQGGLACCDSWGRKESDMTERLNWTEPESSSQNMK